MIATWMAYTLVSGTLVALACLVAERIARASHRATRGIWLGGMVMMLLLSGAAAAPESLLGRAISPMRWEDDSRTTDVVAGAIGPNGYRGSGLLAALQERVGRSVVDLNEDFASAHTRLAVWDGPLLATWVLVAAFLAGIMVHAAAEGRRLRHGLEMREVAGAEVLLTQGIGPSAAGIAKPAILLPTWVLELDDALLTLVVRHEREHVEARDPLLLLASLVAVVLLPWHLPLWWSWRRLRLAIEVDCDRRVLRAHPSVRRYAELLLLTAQRASGPPWASRAVVTVVAPLRPRASHLAKRISTMTSLHTPPSLVRLATAALGVLGLVGLVLAIPTPGEAAGQERAIVRLTEVGIGSTDPTPSSIVIYSTGSARVGLGADAPMALSDTLRLSDRLPAITADVTDGDLHIELRTPGEISVGGTVTGGPALKLSARGRHIVLLKGGYGIRPNG